MADLGRQRDEVTSVKQEDADPRGLRDGRGQEHDLGPHPGWHVMTGRERFSAVGGRFVDEVDQAHPAFTLVVLLVDVHRAFAIRSRSAGGGTRVEFVNVRVLLPLAFVSVRTVEIRRHGRRGIWLRWGCSRRTRSTW